jgi:hypothetical protein
MSVTKGRDDLRVGVKCQSNPEIAGSPRNAFRCSLTPGHRGGSALTRRGGFPLTDPNQTTNAACGTCWSETVGAKFHGREGNSPDRRLRSRSSC